MTNRFSNSVWWLSLALSTLAILCTNHLPTGDAPCHMYNSRLIAELWQGNATDYLSNFYFLNEEIVPNWLTNIIHIPLLLLFGPTAAEKLFYTIYVFVFGFGIRYLLRQIEKDSSNILAAIGIIFIWAKPTWMGFSNNMLSLALAFWVIGYYLKHRNNAHACTYLIFFLGTLVLYFAHPVGYVFAFLGIFSYGLALLFHSKNSIKSVLIGHIKYLACCIPTVFLLIRFASKRTQGNQANTANFMQKLDDILYLKSLIGLSSKERDIVLAFSIFIISLLVLTIWKRRSVLKMELILGCLIWLLFSLLLVFAGPASFAGGTEVAVRLGFLPHLVTVFLSATFIDASNKWLASYIGVGAIVFSILLQQIRLPIQLEASALVDEVVSCEPWIKPESTILTLNYDYSGKNSSGQPISNKVWLFNHVGCYLGHYKTLAIADNYEANMWYFPIISRWETNMYSQTDKEGINFDHFPPRADILNYKQRTGQDLDYVLFINYPDIWAEHPFTKEIELQLLENYRKVHTSNLGRAILYEKNSRYLNQLSK